jgi:hypothetical protein
MVNCGYYVDCRSARRTGGPTGDSICRAFWGNLGQAFAILRDPSKYEVVKEDFDEIVKKRNEFLSQKTIYNVENKDIV